MVEFVPYQSADAELLCKWASDEKTFYNWSAGKLGAFPPTTEAINKFYGGCIASGKFFAFMAICNGEKVGHVTMRYIPENSGEVRLGFIILNGSCRGRGLGKKIVTAATNYAQKNLHAQVVSIMVFEENIAALSCYLASKFKFTGEKENCVVGTDSRVCLKLAIKK
jgi:RimJ/RimL family protein N-acetyltransferase